MANPNPPKPPTIAELGGLQIYLDSDTQRAKHNGLGYKEFSAMVFNETPVAKIMKRMDVKSPNTVKSWVAMHKDGSI